jgi:hypothetical protein
MTLEEAQAKLMRDFEIKIMPDLSSTIQTWRPVEHEKVDIDRWKWEQYPVLTMQG